MSAVERRRKDRQRLDKERDRLRLRQIIDKYMKLRGFHSQESIWREFDPNPTNSTVRSRIHRLITSIEQGVRPGPAMDLAMLLQIERDDLTEYLRLTGVDHLIAGVKEFELTRGLAYWARVVAETGGAESPELHRMPGAAWTTDSRLTLISGNQRAVSYWAAGEQLWGRNKIEVMFSGEFRQLTINFEEVFMSNVGAFKTLNPQVGSITELIPTNLVDSYVQDLWNRTPSTPVGENHRHQIRRRLGDSDGSTMPLALTAIPVPGDEIWLVQVLPLWSGDLLERASPDDQGFEWLGNARLP